MPDLSKIEDLIKEVNFPLTKQTLIDKAKEKGVPDFILSKIQDIDIDKFENADQLKDKLGFLGKAEDKLQGLKNMF